MRRTLFAVLAFLILLPVAAQAQERSAEVQALDSWIGEWTYVLGDSNGTMEFELFGDLMKGSEVTGGGNDVVHMAGYDAEEGVYRWRRYYSSGYTDAAEGWIHGNTWTWLFVEPVGRIRRMTMVFESEDSITFRWERSVEGGAWEVTGEGRSTRVR